MTSTLPAARRSAAPAAAVVAAILLLGAQPPRADHRRLPGAGHDPAPTCGIGEATAGLLTSLPVLCFGLATPAGVDAAGPGRARPRACRSRWSCCWPGSSCGRLDGLPSALAGTLLIGVAITVGNVAVPVVIARDLAAPRGGGARRVHGRAERRVDADAGAHRAARPPRGLAGGAGVVGRRSCWWRRRCGGTRCCGYASAARPVPAPRVPGAGGPGGAAAATDGPRPRRRPTPDRCGGAARSSGGSRRRSRARLSPTTASRPGCRCCCATSSGWPPPGAGTSASVFQIAALVGAFGVPVLLRLFPGPRPVVLIVTAAWTTLPLGLLLAPAAVAGVVRARRRRAGRRAHGDLRPDRPAGSRPHREPSHVRAGPGRQLRPGVVRADGRGRGARGHRRLDGARCSSCWPRSSCSGSRGPRRRAAHRRSPPEPSARPDDRRHTRPGIARDPTAFYC